MKIFGLLFLMMGPGIGLLQAQPLIQKAFPSSYDVVFDTPSPDASGSVPLGNGDVGLNVWVTREGEVCLLVGKTDSYDENSNLLKPGLVRLHFGPEPFGTDTSFRLAFHPATSSAEIRLGKSIWLNIWVDANHPVVVAELSGAALTTVTMEVWRTEERVMTETQVSDLFKNLNGTDPYPTITYPDSIYDEFSDKLAVFHQNLLPANDPYLVNVDVQGLSDYAKQVPHPLASRTFGLVVSGEHFRKISSTQIVAGGKAKKQLLIACLGRHPYTGRRLVHDAADTLCNYEKVPLKSRWKDHTAWWNRFWQRSYVEISGSSHSDTQEVYDLSRAYNLCRYMNGAAGRGSIPVKFNGSIFSYGRPGDYDYRRWGGPGFWFQNQRLIYWPMPAQGDFDLMKNWFEMYRLSLPLQKYRTYRFFSHDGAFFPETLTFWGAEVTGHYGWTPFGQRKNPAAECSYITYYWQNGIEQLLMMTDYFRYTSDTVFLKEVLLPHAEEITKFYDLHYRLDNHGRIHMGPASSLETYHVAINPLPEIAGLQYTLNALLNLQQKEIKGRLAERCKRLLLQLPDIPSAVRDGDSVLLPAKFYEMKMNVENPELYAVFPYRIFGVGKPDIEVAINTFRQRENRWDYCWSQNAIDAALLGLTDTVKKMVIDRARPARYNQSRFPAFWNQNNDWIPDMDHGGVLQIAVNYMLLQCEGDKIRLMPAWPKEWNVRFKLFAPGNTTVECWYAEGKIIKLNVLPAGRLKDVVLPSWIVL